jgi:MYXO-CTERM domain-containing protein
MNSIKLSAAALIFTGSAFADFDGATFTVEQAVDGYDTYRVFMNFTSPSDKMLAVNGDVDGGYTALSYQGGELYNANYFTPFGFQGDDVGAFDGAPGFEGDSFVTIGGQASDVAFSPNFLDDNLNEFNEKIQGSSFLWENNGGYYDQNPGSGAFDTGAGVLVAQLTVASGEDITFGGTASFNSNDALTFASFEVTTVPAPGALALLGLAGLGRRRRG